MAFYVRLSALPNFDLLNSHFRPFRHKHFIVIVFEMVVNIIQKQCTLAVLVLICFKLYFTNEIQLFKSTYYTTFELI